MRMYTRRRTLRAITASVAVAAMVGALVPGEAHAAGAVDCTTVTQQLQHSEQQLAAAEAAYLQAEAALGKAEQAQQQAQKAYDQSTTASDRATQELDAATKALNDAKAAIAAYDRTLNAVSTDAAAAQQLLGTLKTGLPQEGNPVEQQLNQIFDRVDDGVEHSASSVKTGSVVYALTRLIPVLGQAAAMIELLQKVRAPLQEIGIAFALTAALGKMLFDELELSRRKPEHDDAMRRLPDLERRYRAAFQAVKDTAAAHGQRQKELDAANDALKKAQDADAAARKALGDAWSADNSAWQAVRQCSGGDATTSGDPHLTTFDGAHYDFQQVGEFIAARSDRDDFAVQVRQAPWAGTSRTVAGNTAAAFQVAGHRAAVYLATGGSAVTTTVDGKGVTAASTTLPGGGTLANDTGSRRATMTWPDGTFAIVSYAGGGYLDLSVGLSSARAGHVSGLLGNANRDPSDDLVTRAGAALPYPATAAQLYGAYSESWRITQAESLFDYAAGQSTATFTDRTFPSAVATVADLSAAVRQAATATCQAAGVTDPAYLGDCILDVGLTGNAATALSAAKSQTVAVAPPAAGELVTNGGFEGPDDVGSFAEYGDGSTAMPGWTVTGSVDQVGSYWAAQDGTQSLDLAGSSSGTITQTVPTTAGTTYVLSWYQAGNPVCGQPLKTLTVTWNGATAATTTFDTTGHDGTNMGWTRHQVQVTATGPTATLAFTDATADHSQCGVALDTISLTKS
ncbi:choice-of-anchor C family protein [Dactylosporangium sp. NPDC051485]|uniref:choice-of-anchor C family protein n=1 Tax=Dactylosporangium sp. NPDC051485 TaxID=3154846 RepID=UPI0034388164